jgi:hypothetical protein
MTLFDNLGHCNTTEGMAIPFTPPSCRTDTNALDTVDIVMLAAVANGILSEVAQREASSQTV